MHLEFISDLFSTTYYMKKVNFSNNIRIMTIPNNNEVVKSCIPYLSNKVALMNDRACIKMINTINKTSQHKILFINDEDIPLKIYMPNKLWCEDETPIKLLEIFSKNREIFYGFVKEFDMIVDRCISKDTSSSLEYISKFYNIRVKINAVSRLM